MASNEESSLTRIQAACYALLFCLTFGSLVYSVFFSPDVPFVTKGIGAPWITAPTRVFTGAIPVDLEDLPEHVFTRPFRTSGDPGEVMLEARGLREVQLYLNGRKLIPDPVPASWRETIRIPLTGKVRVGYNELSASVRNASGPPLLQARIVGNGIEIETDTSWKVTTPEMRAGASTFVALASDIQLLPEAMGVVQPAQVAQKHIALLVGMFAAFACASFVFDRKASKTVIAQMPRAVLGLMIFYWLVLFATKFSRLPVMMGFDIPAHLAFIDYLLEHHRLPAPDEGWSTYHPPLYHVLTALSVGLTGVAREGVAGQVAYRAVAYLGGLAMVGLSYVSARRLFQGDPLRTSLAVAFTGLLPMNIYMSAYLSNEPLHACWISLAMTLALGVLCEPHSPLRRVALVGGVLGLAILTKFTSLILIPIFAVVLGIHAGSLDRDGRPRSFHATPALKTGGLVLAMSAVVAGWFYVRNFLRYGNFIVWNVNLPGTIKWWEQPGFHTVDYYTKFGESLKRPFFAGFHSFWDGIYSTLWGDGLVAGMVQIATRHPMWNYDFMTLSYPIGLPISILVAVGFARSLERAFRASQARERIAYALTTTVLYTLGFSLFLVTFQLPYYAQAKAFYILSAAIPLALVAANGLAEFPARLDAVRHIWLRALYFGWLGMSAGVLALSFLG